MHLSSNMSPYQSHFHLLPLFGTRETEQKGEPGRLSHRAPLSILPLSLIHTRSITCEHAPSLLLSDSNECLWKKTSQSSDRHIALQISLHLHLTFIFILCLGRGKQNKKGESGRLSHRAPLSILPLLINTICSLTCERAPSLLLSDRHSGLSSGLSYFWLRIPLE